MKKNIEVEEAIEILNKAISPIGVNSCNILKVLDYISAKEVVSRIDYPSFNKSVMDGYAIIARESYPMALKVIGNVNAGDNKGYIVRSNEAIKINTGGIIPEGANAVVKIEDVNEENDFIKINTKIKEMQNISLKGEDIRKGDIVLEKNKSVNFASIGMLATCGIDNILVYKRPKIAVITTGSELVEIGGDLATGKIYNSNKYWLLSKLIKLNYEVVYVESEADDIEKIKGKCIEALSIADVIITTGGVSVGEKDYLKDVINSLNGEILFWKVNIKPGSAFLASKVNDKFIFSLSGNPNAALTTFELLVVPSLKKLSGAKEVKIKSSYGTLINDYSKESNKRRYIRGKLTLDNGQVFVEILSRYKGNGTLISAVDSKCLIEISKGSKGLTKGEKVKFIES